MSHSERAPSTPTPLALADGDPRQAEAGSMTIMSPSEAVERAIDDDRAANEDFLHYDGGVPLMNIVMDGKEDTADLIRGTEMAFRDMWLRR